MATDTIRLEYEISLKKLQKDHQKLRKQFDLTERKAKQSGKKIETSFNSLGNKLKKIGPLIGVAFGVGAILAFGKGLLRTSAQMEAFEKRARTVFGNAIDIVEEFGRKNAKILGLTENQFLGASAAIGDMIVPLGISRERAAQMSTQLVKLGGALKFFTGDTRSAAEISEIFARALTGEVEALKPLGVSISQNSKEFKDLVKQKMADEGATELQAKALAIYEFSLLRSTDALNAFENDTGSLIRTQAEFSANIGKITDGLARALNPAFTAAISIANIFLEALTGVNTELEDMEDNFEELSKVQKEEFNTALEDGIKVQERMNDEIRRGAILTEEDEKRIRDKVAAERRAIIAAKELADTEITADENRSLSLEVLKKRLKEAREEREKAVIGSQDFATAQANIVRIEEQIAIALGKETEAQKETQKEWEKVIKIIEVDFKNALQSASKDIEEFIKQEEGWLEEFKQNSADRQSSLERSIIIEGELGVERATNLLDQEIAARELLKERQAIEITNFKGTEQEKTAILNRQEQERLEVQNDFAEKNLAIKQQEIERSIALSRNFVSISSNLIKLLGDKNAKFTQQAALFSIAANTAVAIAEAIKDASKVGVTPIEKAILITVGIAQVIGAMLQAKQILRSEPLPKFKEGKVDIQGPGTETSDSIPIRVSKHESVMKAAATKKYKGVLEAANQLKLDEYLSENYFTPMMKQQAEQGIGFDDTNLIYQLKKNKSVKIANPEDFRSVFLSTFREREFISKRSW